jgi:tetratricopeptide (TPR) repeat protein
MLASPAMRAAAQRATIPAAAVPVLVCALLFADGSSYDPLVWIGGAALVLAALGGAAIAAGWLPAPLLSRPALAFAGCLAGLAVWSGASILWSTQPDNSWLFTNRTLVYAAFAALGLLAGGLVRQAPRRVAEALAALLALVLGWALLAKAVPSLYPDYGRVARLRSPIEYWNELALLGDVAVGLALWLAAPRARRPLVRAAGALLLYGAALAVLLTYSRFGIGLAIVVALAWTAFERERVESLVALLVAGAPAVGVFLFALSLPGISKDHQSHAQRVHDGWRFGLVALAGAVLVALAALAAVRAEQRRPLSAELRTRVDRIALRAGVVGVVAAIVLAGVFAGRIWNAFTNPVTAQITNNAGRIGQLSSSNRWTWWQEAWHAFTGHPLGGTGAGTFDLTNRLHRTSPYDVATEPHNTPLQFLSELGIVGFLLFAGAAAAAVAGILRARRRSRDAAVTALGLGLAAWLVHTVVDMDWSYVAVCGPLLFAAGALLAGESDPAPAARRRRPLLAVGAVAFALVAVYALASPWLSGRSLASSTAAVEREDFGAALADAKTAHSYDPLSTQALLQWAALETDPAQARQLYRRAIAISPLDPELWYELGAFEYGERNWAAAYHALDRSWGLDRHGPAGIHCGLLDRVRPRVTGYGPSCPAGS